MLGHDWAGLARSLCAARVALALLLLLAAPLLPEVGPDQQSALAWVVALVWLPVTGALFLLALHGGGRRAAAAGAGADAALLLAAQLVAPEAAPGIVVLGLLAVGLHAALGGRGAGFAAAAAIAVTSTAAAVAEGHHGNLFTVSMFAGAGVVLTLLVDRTTRVQREARRELASLQDRNDAILARVADGVMVTDAAGSVRQWNEAAERIFDCPKGVAVGRRCQEVLGLHVDSQPLDCTRGCALLAAPASSDPSLGVEVWRSGPAGQRQPLLANVSAVTGEDGRLFEIVHSLRDVTGLKRAEEAKNLFLATASHELKTPLTVIQGFAQTMLANPGFAGKERDRALEAVVRRAVELSKIVDRLLLSSRIEAGRVELQVSPVDLAPILVERTRALAEATERRVEMEVDDALPPAVVDGVAFATVVDHLLDNAVKYSPVTTTVVLGARAGTTHVEVWVVDEGIGMADDEAARCFEKFWQAESSDSRRFGGTGIGLYIVRSLVEAMGGRVTVESALGSGTKFLVRLARAGAAPAGGSQGPEPSVIREVMRHVGVASRGAI